MSFRRSRWVLLTIAAAVMLTIGITLWWILTPNHAYRIHPQTSNEIRLVADSAEVRRLISLDEKRFQRLNALRWPAHMPSI